MKECSVGLPRTHRMVRASVLPVVIDRQRFLTRAHLNYSHGLPTIDRKPRLMAMRLLLLKPCTLFPLLVYHCLMQCFPISPKQGIL